MIEQKTSIRRSFFKKIFVKICRIFGYEIIDQSNFYVPTQKKALDENLSTQGKKSITIPLGEVEISRKIKALTVIFRSCTSVNMLTQYKKRLFDHNKSEYTFRSLNSIITSLNRAKITFPKIEFDIVVIDHNSKKSVQAGDEGCLSIPEIRLVAERYDKIKVRYFNRDGKKIKKPLSGFMSRVFQHELDHLDGKLMVENNKIKNVYRISENENIQTLYSNLIQQLSSFK